MKHLDLFSGIGGFALASRWMQWETIGFVEIDKFCQKVLAKNFPNIPIHGDIKTFNGTSLRGTIDILTGGFPCQPFSQAGTRKGTDDDRYLWPEMLRVIREVQPAFIVGENVHGLVNWSGGLVFEEVQTSLENEGYEVASVILPACGVQAPHRRDRIWFIAYAAGNFRGNEFRNERHKSPEIPKERSDESFVTTNSYNHGLHGPENRQGYRKGNDNNTSWQDSTIESTGCSGEATRKDQPTKQKRYISRWESFPSQSPICRRDDGIPNRVDRIKGLGNAVVPQVVFEIYKSIEQTLINYPSADR